MVKWSIEDKLLKVVIEDDRKVETLFFEMKDNNWCDAKKRTHYKT